MKRWVCLFITVGLIIGLLAGCQAGGGTGQNGDKEPAAEASRAAETSAAAETSQAAESSAAESVPAESVPEPAEESSAPEPTGPVELNQVLYEDHGVRITAVQVESFMYQYDSLPDSGDVLRLDLRIEATAEEHGTVQLENLSLNGWVAPAGYYGLPGHEGFGTSFELLTEQNEEDFTITFNKKFADMYSIGEPDTIRLALRVFFGDDESELRVFPVKLADTENLACTCSFEQYRDGLYLMKVTNNFPGTVKMHFVIHGTSEDGEVRYSRIRKSSGGFLGDYVFEDGMLLELTSGFAEEERYYAYYTYNDVYWYDQGHNGVNDNIADAELEWIGCTVFSDDDYSGQITYQIEEIDNTHYASIPVRFGMPEGLTKMMGTGTVLTYDANGEILQFGYIFINPDNSKDYSSDEMYSASYLLNPETGFIEGGYAIVDYARIGLLEFARCELIVNYAIDMSR